jgi:hypothetical protein
MPMPSVQRKLLHYTGFVHPIVCLLIGGAFLIGPFWFPSGKPDDLETIALLGALGAAFLLYGAFMLRRQLKQDTTTPVLTVADLPPAERARQLRRFMWIIPIVLIPGAAWIAYDLVQVEFGTARSVRVWAPVALMYNLFGFWPAVLFLPVLGGGLFFAMAWSLRTIKEKQTGRI